MGKKYGPRITKHARAISDANWSELVRQLEYKAEWYGRELIKVDRYFPSSKRCSNCGHIVEKLPLNIREWNCPECGSHHDRDINAGINILRMGTRVGVRRKRSDPAPPTARLRNADQERERPRSKAAGLAVSAPVAHGGDPLWRRWQVFRSDCKTI
ncbi:MAG: transposase [Okeania sp. SIO2F4]|nr:transposase [Okeania sp. SIO2F4]